MCDVSVMCVELCVWLMVDDVVVVVGGGVVGFVFVLLFVRVRDGMCGVVDVLMCVVFECDGLREVWR